MSKGMPQQLALMKTFQQVAAAGSLSQAAKLHYTSQPTLSRQLRILEDYLGVQLINRCTHGINLTEAGKRYYEYTQVLMSDLESFEENLRGNTCKPSGVLRVMVPKGFCEDELVAMAAQYLDKYPETRLEWKLGREAQFDDGMIDCAITMGQPKDESLIARKLTEINMTIVASPALLSRYQDISSPEDICKLPWVALPKSENFTVDLTNQSNQTYQVSALPSFVPDSINALWLAAISGVGLALLPGCYVAKGEATGKLKRVLPEWSTEPERIYLVYPQHRHYPSRLRKFIDHTLSLGPDFFYSTH